MIIFKESKNFKPHYNRAMGKKIYTTTGVKLAVTLLFVVIVTVVVDEVPLTSPLQLSNPHPLLAFAVNVTIVSAKYWPLGQLGDPLGSRITLPAPDGLTFVVSV